MRSKSRPDAAFSGSICDEVGQREHVLLGVDDLGRAAHAAERFVDRDTREPCLETGGPAELVEVVIGADVRGLHDVARLVVVAHDAAREPEQQPVVPPHQELEERGIARQHARDDAGVGDHSVGDRFSGRDCRHAQLGALIHGHKMQTTAERFPRP